MSLNFVEPMFIINGDGETVGQLQFYRQGFYLNGSYSPTYQDVTVSGDNYVNLPNAKADGLNYLKLYGGCEQSGTGDPSPSNIMPIWCNNGEIKVRNTSGLPLGYKRVDYISSNGAIDLGIKTNQNTVIVCDYNKAETIASQYLYYSDSNPDGTTNTSAYVTGTNGNWRFGNRVSSISLPTGKHQSYQSKTGVWVDNSKLGTYSSVANFTSTNNLVAFSDISGTSGLSIDKIGIRSYGSQSGVYDYIWLACQRYDGVYGFYDTAHDTFHTNPNATITGGNVIDSIEIYTDGTVETVKDSLNNTATAEILLSVDTYKDIQEVLAGDVTRNVGIKVLDGTEDWSMEVLRQKNNFYLTFWDIVGGSRVLCTIAKYATDNYSYVTVPSCKFLGKTFNIIPAINTTTFPTVASWKEYLAGQCANGTPVIIVCPLETATTETVTPQTLTLQKGSNTIEITQASISPLRLEAQYKAGVGVTVTEVENANLDNSVTVTIS